MKKQMKKKKTEDNQKSMLPAIIPADATIVPSDDTVLVPEPADPEVEKQGIKLLLQHNDKQEKGLVKAGPKPFVVPVMNKYVPKKGFGVKSTDLVEEEPLVKIWRKDMLKTYSFLEQFGNWGKLYPNMVMNNLQRMGYDMSKLNEKPQKKETHFLNGSPYKKMIELDKHKTPFIHSHTTSSTIIETAEHIYLYGCTGFTYKEMHLRKKLKADILANIESKNIAVPDLSNEDSVYMEYSEYSESMDLDSSLVDIEEFDISKAYYYGAFILGYMSEEIFNQCLALPKPIRLRFIGSIATFKRHYLHSGFDITGYFGETHKLLRRVWFHIVKYVDDCMQEFKNEVGDDFLMYYVDGIYVRKYKPSELGKPAELIDYAPILNSLKEKYGFTFTPGVIFGMTRLMLKAGKGRSNGLNIYKKNDKERKEFTSYWMKKQFNIAGGGKRNDSSVPQWQRMVEAYKAAGNNPVKALELMKKYEESQNT